MRRQVRALPVVDEWLEAAFEFMSLRQPTKTIIWQKTFCLGMWVFDWSADPRSEIQISASWAPGGALMTVESAGKIGHDELRLLGLKPSSAIVMVSSIDLLASRDGRRCCACGSTKRLTRDHIWPRSRGGCNCPGNLELLCYDCNQAKADRIDERGHKRCARDPGNGRSVTRVTGRSVTRVAGPRCLPEAERAIQKWQLRDRVPPRAKLLALRDEAIASGATERVLRHLDEMLRDRDKLDRLVG